MPSRGALWADLSIALQSAISRAQRVRQGCWRWVLTSLPWESGGELLERFQQRSDMGTLNFRWGVLATV